MKRSCFALALVLILGGCQPGPSLDQMIADTITEGNLIYHLKNSADSGYRAWKQTYDFNQPYAGEYLSYPDGGRMHVVLATPGLHRSVLFECYTDTFSYQVTDTNHVRRPLSLHEEMLFALLDGAEIQSRHLVHLDINVWKTTIIPYQTAKAELRAAIITETVTEANKVWGGDFMLSFAHQDSLPIIEEVHPVTYNDSRPDTVAAHRHSTTLFSPIDYCKLRMYRDEVSWKSYRIYSSNLLMEYWIDMPTLSVHWRQLPR